ncbi:metallophosphoesterase family protein [Marinicrinis sediminis]|uniref:Metallophosphoesterase n=1 Tax=Marinicrinis sediminis TaxID=1652465 RepID=A0ABW5REQ5_9BACL
MKILVVADEESTYIWDHFERDRFKEIELIISCGDLKAAYLSYLVTMINAPLMYVHGNHDDYERTPPEGCESIEGKMTNFKGIRILGVGGSQRYSNGNWQFTEKQMKNRLRKLAPRLWYHRGVDLLVTHAPAYQIGDGTDPCHRGFQCFQTFVEKYQPSYMIHGHQHLNYGRNKRIHSLGSTQIINGFGYYILNYENEDRCQSE